MVIIMIIIIIIIMHVAVGAYWLPPGGTTMNAPFAF